MERHLVEARVAHLSRMLGAHAGGLELTDVSEQGAVKVRFTGMCTGCPYKALTMAATVRPGLLAIPGVCSVEAEGGRISVEAEERLASYLAADARSRLPRGVEAGAAGRQDGQPG
jgi:Fe-S cluster biogenesis protein NfuA